MIRFRSQWPWPLTFRFEICSPSYSCPGPCFHQIWFQVNWKHVTNRQTDGVMDRTEWQTDRLTDEDVQRLMRSAMESRIIPHGHQSSRRQAISATVKSATNQLGDTSRSTRRQFVSLECLFRIDRTKQVEQESRAIAGKPRNAAVNFEYGVLNE